MEKHWIYEKLVTQQEAAMWLTHLAERAAVTIYDDKIIGYTTDCSRLLGISKCAEFFCIFINDAVMASTYFKSSLMTNKFANSSWYKGVLIIDDEEKEKLLIDNWDWQKPVEERLPEVTLEDLGALIGLQNVKEQAEEYRIAPLKKWEQLLPAKYVKYLANGVQLYERLTEWTLSDVRENLAEVVGAEAEATAKAKVFEELEHLKEPVKKAPVKKSLVKKAPVKKATTKKITGA